MALRDEVMELLDGSAIDALASRVGLSADAAAGSARDAVTALVRGGGARLGVSSTAVAVKRVIGAADPSVLQDVPGAIEAGSGSSAAMGFLGSDGLRHAAAAVAARHGISRGTATVVLGAVAPVLAAWLHLDDRSGPAALVAGGDDLAGTPWLVAGTTEARLGSLGRRPVLWGAGIAALLVGGILGASLGLRGDDDRDDRGATTTVVETTTTAKPVPAEPEPTTPDETTPAQPADVGALLTGVGGYGALLQAVPKSPTVSAAIADRTPVTIFAPDDVAFRSLPESALADPAALDGILGYHVVKGALGRAQLVDGRRLRTLIGRLLAVTVVGGVVRVGGTPVKALGKTADGDVVYGVRKVLRPPATVNAEVGLEPITFESGSAVITPAGRAVLDRAVRFLRSTPLRLRIEGHTDSSGDAAANLDLSNRRSISVRDYLVARGIRTALLTTRGFGETNPVATNDTEAGKARNRRIEFVVLDT